MSRRHGVSHRTIILTLAAISLLAPTARSQAQWPKPTAHATRLEADLQIDGKLDEPAWAAAEWHTEFTSASAGPENAGPPKPAHIQTRFKVLYDRNALYIGVGCDEPTPDKIRAETKTHDGMVFTDDCIEIFFDPAGEGRYYHHYVINTNGVWYDDHNADYGLVHAKLWDAAIEAAAHIDPEGKQWTAEVGLPFGALELRGDAKRDWLWNVTRERYAGGAQELSSWSPLKGNFHSPRRFGKLTGVAVDFSPFALRVSEPRVSVSRAASGVNTLDISAAITNETGADRSVLASAMIFGQPKTRVTADPISVAAGAEASVVFPKLNLRGSLPAANVLFAFEDSSTGDLLRSVVKRLCADYRPIAITVLRPCYRNNIYATEKLEHIVFRVKLAPDVAERTDLVGYRLAPPGMQPTWAGKIGPAGLDRPLKLPAASLPEGEYALQVQAWDRDGEAIASAETTIRKLPPPEAGNEVRIDQYGNILLNGKPFVAIGWYGSVSTDDPRSDVVALQNLQTPAVIYPPEATGLAERFNEHGIYSIVSVENGRLFYSFKLWQKKDNKVSGELKELTTPSDEMRGYLRELIQTVRGEPGLLGYYIADEPEISNTRSDYLENHYRLLCELDPYHPVVVTNDTLDGIVTHGYKCADILSPDPYNSNYDYVPNFMKRCHEVLRPGQAIILTPWHASSQTHFTRDYGTAPPYPYKVFRNQYLVSLAYGSRGWTAYSGSFFMPEVEYRYGLPYVWREVRFLEQAMAAPPPEKPLEIEADAEMTGWIRAADGDLYLVVVNHKPGARQATIGHPLLSPRSSLIVMSEGRDVPVRDGRFTDQFAEGDAHIYTTRPDARAFKTTRAIENELAQRKKDSAKPGNLLHVSRGARALASKGYYAPWFHQYYYYAINGITDDIGWQASHAGDKPAWLELALREPANVGRIVIYTPNLKDYDLQLRGPEGELHVAQIRDNEETVIEHNFDPPIACLKLRVTALSAREGKRQISEIEAYEASGEGPVTPLIEKQGATTVPKGIIPPADTPGPNALWSDDFTNFESRDKYYWDGKDTKWVFNPNSFKATPNPGGGIVCTSISEKGGSAMTHILPYDSAYRFFQVNLSGIEGKGYRFVNVGFGSSSGKPGYRGAINTSRPGIYTVDTHYIHDSYRTGTAKKCFVTAYMGKLLFTFDWMRLVRRPEDGLVVMMADGSPLPAALKQGDELLFQLVLKAPATDATVDVMTSHTYSPLQINGEPYIQLVKVGERDGREWAASVTLAEDTGKFDQQKAGYPVVFRATVTGGEIRETYASAFVSFQ